MIVKSFNKWQVLNEQEKLNLKSKEESEEGKSLSKSNRKKYRKDTWISETGAEYVLTKKRKSSRNSELDTFVLKGKGKNSPIWDKDGKIVSDVVDFLSHELMSGSNEGKYDEDSIEIEKYKDAKSKDKVTFTIGFAKEDADDAPEKAEDEKDMIPKDAKFKSIELPKNDEGETRIEIGQESAALPEIKEIIRAIFSKKGFVLGQQFGMDWLDTTKLEEKDIIWIKALRAGFQMSDANYISQGLVDKLVDQANEWSKEDQSLSKGSQEEVASNESRLFKFSEYVALFEDFDMTAAMKVVNDADKEEPTEKTSTEPAAATATSNDSNTEATVSTGEGLTDEQAVAYRAWANSEEKLKNAYGKTSTFDLDATGTNNSFVARSYAQAKADYESGEGDSNMLKKVWATTGEPNQWRAEFEKAVGIEPELGEGLPMGYIQYKSANEIAVHFASPRPAVGTVKAGDIVVFKNGWDGDDFGYLVKRIWKDSNGNLGALYIDSPSYVKEFGKPNKDKNFENKASIVTVTQAETSNLKDMFLRTATDDQIAEKISRKIVALWNPSNGYFNKYKGTFNDNEAGAISYFTTWWNGQINPLMDTLKGEDPNKAKLSAAFNTIIAKAEGSSANDTATWYIDTLAGSKKYSVDTDF
jgi:hypothetical protein